MDFLLIPYATFESKSMRALLLLLAFYSSSASFALEGEARIIGDTFFKKAKDRPNGTASLALAPRFSSEGDQGEAVLDLEAMLVQGKETSFLLESPETYLATGPSLSSFQEFTLGRRIFEWSFADRTWSMGLWSPRFLSDPLRPETIGLTGAFYSARSGDWDFLAFASPLSVPERGFPLREEDGVLTSDSPWATTHLYRRAVLVQGTAPVPIYYRIEYPPLSKLVLKAGGAIRLRYRGNEEAGAWAGLSYGVLPIHQINLAVDPAYLLQDNVLLVKVHPRVQHHHLLTGESGYRSDAWQAWGSLTGEFPITLSTPASQITMSARPSLIGALGGAYSFNARWKASASLLLIHEKEESPTDSTFFKVDLPSRYDYTRATKLRADWSATERARFAGEWIFDLENRSHLLSTDLIYSFPSNRWKTDLGADFFFSSSGEGFLGQYEGNDRVRLSVAYSF